LFIYPEVILFFGVIHINIVVLARPAGNTNKSQQRKNENKFFHDANLFLPNSGEGVVSTKVQFFSNPNHLFSNHKLFNPPSSSI